MAERRMFAKTIIDSDAFLDMPISARLLYYDLGMRADDDGFVNNPRKIMKTVSASEDDRNLLILKKFIIPFESGIVVIKHWKIHNYIQKDRYIETKYKEEKALLELDENKAYRIPLNVENPPCIQNVYIMDTQVRLGKVRKGKLRLGKDTIIVHGAKAPVLDDSETFIKLTLNDKSLYPVKMKSIEEWKILYPNVDVLQELKKMKGWLDANPKKRKTIRGIQSFINSWLCRQQDKGSSYSTGNNKSDNQYIELLKKEME